MTSAAFGLSYEQGLTCTMFYTSAALVRRRGRGNGRKARGLRLGSGEYTMSDDTD